VLKKKRWQLVFLLFLAGVVNYLDRSALSVAAPLVTRDLGLSPADLGLIFSSFFVGYAIFNFIGGWASDKLGGKRVFALAMGVWSAFCALTAAATGFVSLLAIRVFFGVGEGPLSSTMNKVVNNWFPHREAASAVGYANCGTVACRQTDLPLGFRHNPVRQDWGQRRRGGRTAGQNRDRQHLKP
jgi:ACS family hexuronate transporter-like MFS transporter